MRPGAAAVVAALACSATAQARADTVTLTNGRVIEADRAWFEGSELRYEKNGARYGLPRTLVQRLEQKMPAEPSSDPDVEAGRRHLGARQPLEALRAFRRAVARDPLSVAALQGLAEAALLAGDPGGAREPAERAARLQPRNAASQAVLGDVLVALGDRAGAEQAYRRSLEARADAAVARKLAEVAPAPVRVRPSGPQFRVRYEGGVNEPLGMAALDHLGKVYAEYAERLGFAPDQPIAVLLETSQDARLPDWADGVNDGTIRVPVLGTEGLSPRLLRVLRHELAHSFVAARTGGNCPTWLHEGLSQWLEGGDPEREDAAAARALRENRLIPLLRLEAPFQTLHSSEVPTAYAESLSVLAFILRRSGEAGVQRLLAALGDRVPSDEALPVALGLSYPELQKAWEAYLAGLDRRR